MISERGEMQTTIYGNEDCAACEAVKSIFPDAEVRPAEDLVEVMTTREIVEHGGRLPVVIFQRGGLRAVLRG